MFFKWRWRLPRWLPTPCVKISKSFFFIFLYPVKLPCALLCKLFRCSFSFLVHVLVKKIFYACDRHSKAFSFLLNLVEIPCLCKGSRNCILRMFLKKINFFFKINMFMMFLNYFNVLI